MDDITQDWKQKPLIVGLLVASFPPLGLYLLWKHPTWQQRTKWISAACYAAFVIVASVVIVVSENEKPKSSLEHDAPLPRSAASPSAPPSSQPSTVVSFDKKYEALVHKIQPGMSQQQVQDLLGSADDRNHTDLGRINPQKAGQSLTILTWRDGDKFIKLGFTNGVLTSGGTPGYDIEKGFHSK